MTTAPFLQARTLSKLDLRSPRMTTSKPPAHLMTTQRAFVPVRRWSLPSRQPPSQRGSRGQFQLE